MKNPDNSYGPGKRIVNDQVFSVRLDGQNRTGSPLKSLRTCPPNGVAANKSQALQIAASTRLAASTLNSYSLIPMVFSHPGLFPFLHPGANLAAVHQFAALSGFITLVDL
jgi:hypothetical protein